MTDPEKLHRITEIVQDQMALEAHQKKTDAEASEIRFSRADAYRHIVQVITGQKPASF
jgi:hypothetical protein